MGLDKLIYSQALTLLNLGCIELNSNIFYNFNEMCPTFFVDVVLTNIVLFLVSAFFMKKEDIKTSSRIYTSVIVSACIYYLYVYEFNVSSNILSLDFCLYFFTFTYFVALIYKYLISDNFPKNNFHFMVIFILFSVLFVMKILSPDVLFTNLIEVISRGILGIIFLSGFYMFTNVLCNEIGVVRYIFLFTPFSVLLLMLNALLKFKVSDILKLCSTFWEYKFSLLIYLLFSVCRFAGTVIFLQKYGIVDTSLLQVNNYVIYRIYKALMGEKFTFRGIEDPRNFLEVMFLSFTYVMYNLSTLKKDARIRNRTPVSSRR